MAGLAAADRLAEGGRYPPVVLEREDRPGGLARSLRFAGVATDLGPHRIHTELPEVEQYIGRIAAPSLLTVRRKSLIYLRGRYLPYPPSPVAMTKHLGPWQMGRFMMGYAAERLRRRPTHETYETFMRRAFGRELYEFLLRPFSAKTWKIDPAELHADTARVRISAGNLTRMIAGLFRRERAGRETSLNQFRYVRGGIETLARHIAEHAQAAGATLTCNRTVEAIELDDNLRVRAVRCAQAPDPVRGEVFLSTVPLPALTGELLPPDPRLSDAREAASGLEYLDMILVNLVVRRNRISDANWLYFPDPDFIFNRAHEAKSFDPEMGPEDRSVLCLEITLRRGDPIAREDDATLIRAVTEQIASTGLFDAAEVDDALVYRLPFAYPLYTLDYLDRLDRVLSGLRRIPNLMTLGRQGLFNHNNMDHSIRMGLDAADRLNAAPPDQAVADWYDHVPSLRDIRIVD